MIHKRHLSKQVFIILIRTSLILTYYLHAFVLIEQQKEDIDKQIQSYQSVVDKLKEICNETDVDRLAAHFLKQEEENFALFNYVNELNNEVNIKIMFN